MSSSGRGTSRTGGRTGGRSRQSPAEEVDISETLQAALPSNSNLVANLAVLAVGGIAVLAFVNIALSALMVTIGLINPAWQTYKALENNEENESYVPQDSEFDDDYVPAEIHRTNWNCYWIIASILYVLVQLLSIPTFMMVSLPSSVIPVFLIPTFLYLTRNQAKNSHRIYKDALKPSLNYIENHVDDFLDMAVDRIEYLSSVAFVRFYNSIEPYTNQLQNIALTSANTITQAAENSADGGLRRSRSKRRRS